MRQSEVSRALLARAKGTFFLKNVPKVDSAGRVIPLRGTGFLHINRALSHITVIALFTNMRILKFGS